MRSEKFWAALVLVAAVNASAVAGEVTNQATADDAQPSTETGQISSELRALAGALSSGSEAMQPFHGLRSQHEDNKDDLNPAIPGMECYIDRTSTMSLVIVPRLALKLELIPYSN